MSYSNDAINTLVEYIYKIIDQRLEENNKKYVDFRLNNLKIDGSQLKENSIPGLAIKDGALSYLKVYDFVAQVASIALAEIGIANINLAKIVKADMETAIIREGIAGEVYIDDLVVASAKFVTAMFGELVIKGQDGLYYQLGVDSEGNVTAVEKTVTSGEIEDGRTTEGFTIIESSITAQNLNVSILRGTRAILMDLFVSTLTASDAYIASLVTPLITSPLGAGLDISANPYLQLSVDNIQVGGRNLLLASELNDVTSWTLSSGVTIDSSVKYYGNKSAKIYATGLTEDANKTLSQNVDSIYWTPGKKYMLSAWQMCPAIASMDAPAYLEIAMNVGGTYQYVTEEITAVEFINNEWRRTIRSFTVPDGTTALQVRFGLRRNGTVYFACPKLEVGDKATDWSPSPDDSVKALKSSSITIIDDSVDVDSTGTINLAAGSSLNVLGAEVNVLSGGDFNVVSGGNVNISAGGKLNVSASDIVLSSEDTLSSKFTQTSEQIALGVGATRGLNLLHGTSGEYEDISLDQYYTALTNRLALADLELAAGDEITLSMSLKAPSVKAVSARITTYSAATGDAGKTVFAPNEEGIIPAGGEGRSVLTMALPAGATHLEVAVANRTSENTATVTVQVKRVQLERGSIATAWGTAPDEFKAGGNISLTMDEVVIAAPRTRIAALEADGSESEVARFDEDGVYAIWMGSPSVMPVYCGPATLYVDPSATEAQMDAGTHFKSLATVLDTLVRRALAGDVTVNLKQSTKFYEGLPVRGVAGIGILKFQTQGAPSSSANYATVYGNVLANGCTAQIELDRLKIGAPHTSGENNLMGVYRSTFVKFTNCIISGNAYTKIMAHVSEGATAFFENCELYNIDGTAAMRCLYVYLTSQIFVKNCKGNMGAAIVLAADMGRIVATGTVPATTGTPTAEWNNGEIRTTGTTADYGNAPPAYVPPTNYTYGTVDSRTRTSAGGWFSDGDRLIRQGYTPQSRVCRGAIWFDLTTLRSQLSGKTVLSATLTLTCVNQGGSMGRLIGLEGITNTGPSGSIAGEKVYGFLDSLAWGETRALDIPVQAVMDLRDGVINALAIYTGETAADVDAGKGYSKRFRVCEGYGTAGAPVLTVTTE